MWKEISISTPIMCIALPSNFAGDGTSEPASSGAQLGSAIGVFAPTFQPATGRRPAPPHSGLHRPLCDRAA